MRGRSLKDWLMIGLLLYVAASAQAHAAAEQPIPIISGRDHSASSQAASDGFVDYLQMVNLRDGGINGVRLRWTECKAGLSARDDIQCIESGIEQGAAIVLSSSAQVASDWIERSRNARVPLLIPASGRTDGLDGRVFPFAFRLSASLPSQAAAQISFIAGSEGGIERLRGKRIAYLYADDESAREAIELLDLLATEYGYRLTRHAVAPAAGDQLATWQGIVRTSPDWVLLSVDGPLTAAALRTAQAVGLPAGRVIGSASSSAEQHLLGAGDAAVGFIAVASTPAGGNFGVVHAIRRHLDPHGQRGHAGEPGQPAFADYLRGVSHGLLIVEAIRLAQRRFGARPLDGEQLRWGLERLHLDDERLVQLGAHQLLPPVTTSCVDHEGSGAVKFQQWLGTRWNVVTDWISGDRALVRRVVGAASKRHADARHWALRDCADD